MYYSVPVAYLLWFIGGLGALGLHRFYLRKYGTGIDMGDVRRSCNVRVGL